MSNGECHGVVTWNPRDGFKLECRGACATGQPCKSAELLDDPTGGIRRFCSCNGNEPPQKCHLELVFDPDNGCYCVRCIGYCDNESLQCKLKVRRVSGFEFEYTCQCSDQS
jgi:hypothetical protein